MWIYLVVFNFVFALPVAIAFRSWISSASGFSLALTRSIGKFDFTFLTDLLRNYPGFSLISGQALIFALGYLIFSAFLSGGILNCYVHHRESFSLKEFLYGSARYFWRILLMEFLFLVVQLIVLFVFWRIIDAKGVNPKEMISDLHFLHFLWVAVPGYLCVALVIAMFQIYGKIHLVSDGQTSVIRAIRKGIRFATRHFGSVILLFLVNAFLFGVLLIIYGMVKGAIPSGSAGGIMLTFVFAQVFLLGRILIRLLTVSSANELMRIFASAAVPANNVEV